MIYNTVAQTVQSTNEYSALGLVNILKDKGDLVGLEIGCDKGDSSDGLLSDLPNITKLYSIDPYINYVDWNGVHENTREQYFQYVTNRLSKFGDRHTLVRKTSDEYVLELDDESYDFIFIDGLHTYDQVLKDCQNYYSKIKSGGVFAGHDYRVIAEVRRAIDEFAASVDATILLTTEADDWYWIKP